MTIYTPFTYIIGWSKHKKFYYGCKFAQGCQPSDLWHTYFTSSEYVKEFREEHGEPDIIRIHRTFDTKEDCILFEGQYLRKIKAKDNDMFLNKANGSEKIGVLSEQSVEKQQQTCLDRYGVKYASQVPVFQEKRKQTCLDRYGTENPSQVPVFQEKRKQTCMNRYDVDHHMKNPQIAERHKNSFMTKHGVENPSQVPVFQEKKKQTWLDKYGVNHPSKRPEYTEKCISACLERYGVTHASKSDIIKERIIKTNLETYGVEWSCQAEEVKTKSKNSWMERYGVDNPAKIMKTCSHCGEFKNIQHEEKCPQNPNRNLWDRNGAKNGRAKTYKIINIETGEFYIVTGELKKFCKRMNISYRQIYRSKNYKWKKIEITKDNE